MQTIQNHVVSLDLAKKLVEVGIKIESEFWWVLPGDYDAWDGWSWEDKKTEFELAQEDDDIYFNWTYGEKYPAPLASELGEVLPVELRKTKDGLHQHYDVTKIVGGYLLEHFIWKGRLQDIRSVVWKEEAYTMPDAMAKMLIYLKEKGLI